MEEEDESDVIFFKWTNCCRLCLSPNAEIDIFSIESSGLLCDIQACLQTLVYKGDPLPRRLCSICKVKLSELNLFRSNCLKVEANIKGKLKPYCKINYVEDYFGKCSELPQIFSTSINDKPKPISIGIQTENDLKQVPKATQTDEDEPGQCSSSVINETHSHNITVASNLFSNDIWNGIPSQEQYDIPITPIKQEDGCVQCSNCSFIFMNLIEFKDHGCLKKINKCEQCSMEFEDPLQLQLHVCPCMETFENEPMIHSIRQENIEMFLAQVVPGKISPWKCNICLTYYKSKINLKTHYEHCKETNESYGCQYCYHRYSQIGDLVQHQNSHAKILIELTEDDLIGCEKCGLQFPNQERLKKHVLNHSVKPSKTFICPYCGKVFSKQPNYANHCRTHKNQMKSLDKNRSKSIPVRPRGVWVNSKSSNRCRICYKKFCSYNNVLRHIRDVHEKKQILLELNVEAPSTENPANDSPLVSPAAITGRRCRMCGKVFSSEAELNVHVRLIHINSTPYPCRRCPQRFPTRSLLLIHMRVHAPKVDGEETNNTEPIEELNQQVKKPKAKYRPKLKCALCSKPCVSLHNFNVHMKFRHPGRSMDPIILDPGDDPIVPSNSLKPQVAKKSTTQVQLNQPNSEVCRYCFKQVIGMNNHIKKKHRGKSVNLDLLLSRGIEIDVNNSLSCKFCYKICSTAFNKIRHESVHTSKKLAVMKCGCGKKFHSKQLFEKHKKTHISSFHCQKCNKIFLKEDSLYRHECPFDTIDGDRKPYKCLKCPKSYDILKSLKYHINAHHNEGNVVSSSMKLIPPSMPPPMALPPPPPTPPSLPPPPSTNLDAERLKSPLWKQESNQIICQVGDKFYCTFHDVEFSTIEECHKHQSIHPRGNWYVVQLTDTLFQCTICDEMLQNSTDVELHIDVHKSLDTESDMIEEKSLERTSVLGQKRKFKCPFCNISYLTEVNLQNHIFYVHPETPQTAKTNQRVSVD